jgi:curved DNA-binding protein CbpA
METLLLFCCQSCLKSDNDIEYYLTLDTTPQASSDEIKRAYKKRSLQLHPDRLAQKGIQVTPEHNLQFQKLKEAYDVLSDPRKRKIYDKIGKAGLKLVDSPQEINPMELLRNFQNNKADRLKLVLIIFLLCCFIVIFPILFCLKCDGRIENVPWVGLWTPMWLLDCILIIASILFLMEREDDDEDDEDHDPERGGRGTSRRNGNRSGGDHGGARDEEDNSPPNKKQETVPFSIKFFFAARSFCFVLLQIFVTMKLDDYLDSWSWFAIFAPWFGYEFFAIVDKFSILFETVTQPDPVELERRGMDLDEHEKTQMLLSAQEEYFKKLVEQSLAKKSSFISVLRIWLACFLALQLDHIVDWDWGLVLLPIWCYLLFEILHGCFLKRWAALLLSGIDLEACANGEIHDPTVLLRAQHGQVWLPSLFALSMMSSGIIGRWYLGMVYLRPDSLHGRAACLKIRSCHLFHFHYFDSRVRIPELLHVRSCLWGLCLLMS